MPLSPAGDGAAMALSPASNASAVSEELEAVRAELRRVQEEKGRLERQLAAVVCNAACGAASGAAERNVHVWLLRVAAVRMSSVCVYAALACGEHSLPRLGCRACLSATRRHRPVRCCCRPAAGDGSRSAAIASARAGAGAGASSRARQ
jgi:hypothetical protein